MAAMRHFSRDTLVSNAVWILLYPIRVMLRISPYGIRRLESFVFYSSPLVLLNGYMSASASRYLYVQKMESRISLYTSARRTCGAGIVRGLVLDTGRWQ
ncbi:hypothetical protein J3E68DRAFT_400053 [Trichoderma sp. SZMC 28012]